MEEKKKESPTIRHMLILVVIAAMAVQPLHTPVEVAVAVGLKMVVVGPGHPQVLYLMVVVVVPDGSTQEIGPCAELLGKERERVRQKLLRGVGKSGKKELTPSGGEKEKREGEKRNALLIVVGGIGQRLLA